jgi:hypothetical protein
MASDREAEFNHQLEVVGDSIERFYAEQTIHNVR